MTHKPILIPLVLIPIIKSRIINRKKIKCGVLGLLWVQIQSYYNALKLYWHFPKKHYTRSRHAHNNAQSLIGPFVLLRCAPQIGHSEYRL